jgi:ABC-type transport system involved in cytochrome bd biosynthesis fused ATPase/permease subunit
MIDDVEEIRAERERPARYREVPEKYAGLWKQIAMGIVTAYCAITILTTIGWIIAAQIITGSLKLNLPW